MAFDVDKLFEFCTGALRTFAAQHSEEEFYAFAIDANMLCMNSEEAFQKTLKRCQEDWDHRNRPIARWEELTEDELLDKNDLLELYKSNKAKCLKAINELRADYRKKGWPFRNAEGILELRQNTGDWTYAGLAKMCNADGFDDDAYEEHYYLDDDEQVSSAYGLAMDELVLRLRSSGVFDCFRTTAAFYAKRVEHNY